MPEIIVTLNNGLRYSVNKTVSELFFSIQENHGIEAKEVMSNVPVYIMGASIASFRVIQS